MNLLKFLQPSRTADYTLIIPSVSVGNIGQLTADVLISHFNLTKLAQVWDPAIVPSVGGDPFTTDSTELCTACELYGSDVLKLAVLQLRSSVEYQLATKFFKKLSQNIVDLKFKQVFILTSCFDYEKHAVDTSAFRYVSNFEENYLLDLKQLDVYPMNSVMNGAGFAVKLYDALVIENLKCTVLIKFSSEGDNRPDALQMLNVLCTILKIPRIETPVYPKSWEFVFGNPPPIGMY